MSATVRKINDWFRNANRYDVNELLEKIILSDRQARIFEMFYLPKIPLFAPKDCIIKINAADVDKIISYIQSIPMA